MDLTNLKKKTLSISFLDSSIIFLTIVIFCSILLLSSIDIVRAFFPTPTMASDILLGRIEQTDLAQDIYGFRALFTKIDPYPKIGDVFPILGVKGPYVSHPSTHPPTAFLLVFPVAFASWPIATAIWGWLMLFCIIFSFRLLDFPWKFSILFSAISLFFPPVATSLGQLTPLWLLGITLSYHFNKDKPFLSGICLAIASLSKFLPGLLLLPYLLKKKWGAFDGFLLTWAIALFTCFLLYPPSFSRYLEINQMNSWQMITRSDNASPIWFAYTNLGYYGLLLTVIIILLFLFTLWQESKQNQVITEHMWNLASFLSVFLLPVLWTYSLLPLLPCLIEGMRRKDLLKYFSWAALFVFIIMPIWGQESVEFDIVGILLIAFIVIFPPIKRESLKPQLKAHNLR